VSVLAAFFRSCSPRSCAGGLLVAGFQYAEGAREYATRLALAALLGVVFWTLVLTA
jgi:hypothetical protein